MVHELDIIMPAFENLAVLLSRFEGRFKMAPQQMARHLTF